jgi:hypothetical protein
MDMPSPGKPTLAEFEQFLTRMRPRFALLFERRVISAEEAGRRLGEALVRLLFRWNRIQDHERWLLATLSKGLKMRPPDPKDRATPRP